MIRKVQGLAEEDKKVEEKIGDCTGVENKLTEKIKRICGEEIYGI